jgi:predicted phage-related endonuclease
MGDIIERRALFAGERTDEDRGRELIRLPEWPCLGGLGLTDSARADRLAGIGGSDANIILSGDSDKIIALWREKRGEAEPSDLCDNLAVMLGCWTEEFNRLWYEKLSGQKVDRLSIALTCPTNAWRRCTLDGYIVEADCIFEAKHTNAFVKSEEVLERYMPQLQHNMAVARVEQAVLSVIFGNHKYEMYKIASDWIYQIELLQAEAAFWNCVETGRPPVPAVPPAAPKPVGVREVCLDGNNAWAAAAADWLEHREAAKLHAGACTSLKELVEPDVARAFGHGVEAKRSKAGSISIRGLAE